MCTSALHPRHILLVVHYIVVSEDLYSAKHILLLSNIQSALPQNTSQIKKSSYFKTAVAVSKRNILFDLSSNRFGFFAVMLAKGDVSYTICIIVFCMKQLL